jgi:hypothetical protein
MEKENVQKIRIQHQPCFGLLWVAAWLFTIGFLHLTLWKGVIAVVLWAYYLGVHFAAVAH